MLNRLLSPRTSCSPRPFPVQESAPAAPFAISVRGRIALQPHDINHGNGSPTALSRAVRSGHADIVRLLLARGAEAVYPRFKAVVETDETSSNWSLVHVAACLGHAQVLEALIEDGKLDPNVDDTQPHRVTALNIASWQRKEDAVRVLLHKGARVDSPASFDGYTALLEAVTRGSVFEPCRCSLIKLLLEAGASSTLQARTGRRPDQTRSALVVSQKCDLSNCCADCGESIAAARHDEEARREAWKVHLATGAELESALRALAAQKALRGNWDIQRAEEELKKLLAAGGFDVNLRLPVVGTIPGIFADETLLHTAACWTMQQGGGVAVVKAVLLAGADPAAENAEGYTPLGMLDGTCGCTISGVPPISWKIWEAVRPLALASSASERVGELARLAAAAEAEREAAEEAARERGAAAAAESLRKRAAAARWKERQQLESLFDAIAARDLMAVRDLLIQRAATDRSADDSFCDEFGWNPLHEAASRNLLPVAEMLLQTGCASARATTLVGCVSAAEAALPLPRPQQEEEEASGGGASAWLSRRKDAAERRAAAGGAGEAEAAAERSCAACIGTKNITLPRVSDPAVEAALRSLLDQAASSDDHVSKGTAWRQVAVAGGEHWRIHDAWKAEERADECLADAAENPGNLGSLRKMLLAGTRADPRCGCTWVIRGSKSALHWAAAHMNRAGVGVLLAAGADHEALDAAGKTPVDLIASRRPGADAAAVAAVRELLERAAPARERLEAWESPGGRECVAQRWEREDAARAVEERRRREAEAEAAEAARRAERTRRAEAEEREQLQRRRRAQAFRLAEDRTSAFQAIRSLLDATPRERHASMLLKILSELFPAAPGDDEQRRLPRLDVDDDAPQQQASALPLRFGPWLLELSEALRRLLSTGSADISAAPPAAAAATAFAASEDERDGAPASKRRKIAAAASQAFAAAADPAGDDCGVAVITTLHKAMAVLRHFLSHHSPQEYMEPEDPPVRFG